MSALAAPPSDFARAYEALAATLPGSGAARLRERRDAAIARFDARGWPGLHDEAWRFFDLRALRRTPFAAGAPADPGAAAAREAAERSLVAGSDARLVFVNGIVAPALSRMDGGATLAVESLATAAERADAALGDALGSLVRPLDAPFTDLNAALWADGARIRVRAGHPAGAPIHLLFIALGDASPRAVHPRLLVEVEPGAEALLVEEYLGVDGAATFTNAVVEAAVGANGSLGHVRVLRERESDFHVASVWVRLDRDARYRGASVALGGRLSRTDLHVELAGEGSECRIDGLYAVGGRSVVDHHTWVDHLAPHTTSDQLFKGVLGGRSRGVFNGRIRIREGAQQTAAEQVNQNLLLSDEALVNTNPQLEIFADDVKCRHGATIGQLDEDRLFYLQSRGIDGGLARRLLVNAFADEVLDRVEPASLRNALVRHLAEETLRDV